jgi:hypothetical protein
MSEAETLTRGIRCRSAAVRHGGVGRINALISRLTFRFMLLKRAYTRNDFERMVAQTKFGRAEIRESLTTLELWLERAPEL